MVNVIATTQLTPLPLSIDYNSRTVSPGDPKRPSSAMSAERQGIILITKSGPGRVPPKVVTLRRIQMGATETELDNDLHDDVRSTETATAASKT